MRTFSINSDFSIAMFDLPAGTCQDFPHFSVAAFLLAREGAIESWWMADRVPVSTKDNSIIMPDVPNFTERHFQYFQRSAGHTSTGETLLYEATNCQN